MHILKGFIGAALGLEIIAVNSQTPGVWPEFSDFLFNPLGTDTDREDIGWATPGSAPEPAAYSRNGGRPGFACLYERP